MRAAIHTQFGDPAKVLELGERPTPQPGKGQVRVAMRRAPIHNHDLWTVRGNYGYKPELPAIGGSEAAGVIDALGEGVEGLQVGQRVVAAGVHEAWPSTSLPTPAAWCRYRMAWTTSAVAS